MRLLFDDLVGAGENRWRDRQPERLRGLEINDQLEVRWLQNRQIGWLGPLQNPSGVNAGLAIESVGVGAIADQAACCNEYRVPIDRRNSVSLCQRHELGAAAGLERIGGDEKRAGLQLLEGGKGGVNLGFGRGLHDSELYTLRARSSLRGSDVPLGHLAVRIHQQCDGGCLRNQLAKQLEQLGHQLEGEVAEAGEVTARLGEAGD